MGDVLASPTTEFSTVVLMAVLPTLVANNPAGVPGSTLPLFDENRIGTAMSHEPVIRRNIKPVFAGGVPAPCAPPSMEPRESPPRPGNRRT